MNAIPQEQMRMAAMEMAVRFLNEHPTDERDLVGLAEQIYQFFIGETK